MSPLRSLRLPPVLMILAFSGGFSVSPRAADVRFFGETLAERIRIVPRDGSIRYGESDIEMNATGFALALRRCYSSTRTVEGVFGRGWSCILDARIEQPGQPTASASPQRIVVRDEFGDAVVFAPRRSGLFLSETGRPQWLVVEKNGAMLRDAHGRFLSFNESGRLNGIFNAAMAGIEIEYDGNRPAAMSDPGGRSIRFKTDEAGRVVEAHSSDGQRLRYEYAQNTLARVSDKDGARAEYACDDRGRLISIVLGAAERADVVYDAAGRIRELRGPGVAPRSVRFKETTLPFRARVTEISDAFGHVMRYRYRDSARECQVTLPTGEPATVDYNERGLPVRMELPQSRRVDFDYDAVGNLTRLSLPGGTYYAFGYSRGSFLAKWTRADGAVFSLERTKANLLSAIRGPQREQVRRFGFDSLGRPAWLADGSERAIAFSRNNRGDLTGVGVRDGAESLMFDHDEAGWISRVAPPGRPALSLVYGPNGKAEALSDSVGYRLGLLRDRQGRWAGVEDNEKNRDQMERDGAGRLQLWRRPDGGETRLAFDREGNLGRVLLPEGNACSLSYDERNLATSDTWAGVRHRIHYDEFGRVAGRLDGNGRTVRMTYDALGHLTDVRMGPRDSWRFQHGADGRLSRMQGRDDDVRFGMDAAGRPTRMSDGRASVWAEYEYDAHGRVAGFSTSGGRWLYQYDALGRLVRVARAGDRPTELRYVYDNDCARLPAHVLLPGGANVAWEYDPYGRRTAVRVTLPSGKTGFAERCTFDGRGNAVRTDSAGRRLDWVYDGPNRLVAQQLNGQDVARLHYGRDGRFLKLESDARRLDLAYDGNGAPVRSFQGQLEYDLQGNRIAFATPEGAMTYRYDLVGRLRAVALPSSLQITRLYSPNGWPVERVSRGRGTSLSFVGDGALWGTGRGDSTTRWFVPDPLWGGVLGFVGRNRSEWAFRDALGRLRAIGAGNDEVREIEWTPLGREWHSEKQILFDALGLEALELDPETGLAGDYDVAQGVTLTPRSLREGMAPYARDPLRWTPPSWAAEARRGGETVLLEDIVADCAAGHFAPREGTILRRLIGRESGGWPDVGSEEMFDCLLDGHSFLTPAELARRVTETVLRDGSGLRASAFLPYAGVSPPQTGLGRHRVLGSTLATLQPLMLESAWVGDAIWRDDPAFAASDNVRHGLTGRTIARSADRSDVAIGEDGSLRLLGELLQLTRWTAYVGPRSEKEKPLEPSETAPSESPHPERLARRDQLLRALDSSL